MENDKNRNYGQSDRNSQDKNKQHWTNSNEDANETRNVAGKTGSTSAENSRGTHMDSDASNYSAQNRGNENSWTNDSAEESTNRSSVESGTNPDRYQSSGRDNMDTEDESETRTPGL